MHALLLELVDFAAATLADVVGSRAVADYGKSASIEDRDAANAYRTGAAIGFIAGSALVVAGTTLSVVGAME